MMSPYHFWRVFCALLGPSHASCRSPYRPLTAREDKSLVRYRAVPLRPRSLLLRHRARFDTTPHKSCSIVLPQRFPQLPLTTAIVRLLAPRCIGLAQTTAPPVAPPMPRPLPPGHLPAPRLLARSSMGRSRILSFSGGLARNPPLSTYVSSKSLSFLAKLGTSRYEFIRCTLHVFKTSQSTHKGQASYTPPLSL